MYAEHSQTTQDKHLIQAEIARESHPFITLSIVLCFPQLMLLFCSCPFFYLQFLSRSLKLGLIFFKIHKVQWFLIPQIFCGFAFIKIMFICSSLKIICLTTIKRVIRTSEYIKVVGHTNYTSLRFVVLDLSQTTHSGPSSRWATALSERKQVEGLRALDAIRTAFHCSFMSARNTFQFLSWCSCPIC